MATQRIFDLLFADQPDEGPPIQDDQWREQVADAIDALPELSSYEQGAQDYHAGVYCPPRGYTAGFERYLAGYNDAWAAENGKTLLR